ncbi:MAG: polyphosphate kinase 2 family protein, partial [Chitinophagaceae bacterium]|nr:polyphosphate kinase 2 family protein [Anaerolineae bacterium]
MSTQLLIPKGEVKLSDYEPDYHSDDDKESAADKLVKLQEKMEVLQERLYAEGKQSLLIVLQAMDAAGKDGTIEKVFDGVNPQGVRVTSFKAPTPEDLAHDFLWRIHQHTPPKGYIGIFNRSHYEDVLVVRVNNLAPEKVWKKRYEHINDFEQVLAENGTRILKFFLHISKAEQKERLQARLDDPEKRWKFSMGDLPVREQWDDYMKAYETLLTKCNTSYAPWHIVPANKKWYRNLIVTETIVKTLEDM